MSILEAIAALLGLLGVVFGMQQRRESWLCWIASSAIYVVVMWQTALYGQLLVMMIFIVMAIWGYRRWGQSETAVTALPVRHLIALVMLTGLASLALASFQVETANPNPWLDSAVTCLSLAAMWLMARRHLLCWPTWGLVNALSVVLYFKQNLFATMVLYALQFALSLTGYRAWRKQPGSEIG